MEYYATIKNNEILTYEDNMDGPWGHYAKWNKSDRKRQIPYDLTYMWNLKQQQQQSQAYRYREQMGGCQGRVVGSA